MCQVRPLHVQTFLKTERLRSRKYAQILFQQGRYKRYPFFVVRYLFVSPTSAFAAESPFAQVLFSVPKRMIKHASKRHRLKRVMQEAYRLHKAPLVCMASETNYLLIGYSYTASTQPNDRQLTTDMKHSIQWIIASSTS